MLCLCSVVCSNVSHKSLLKEYVNAPRQAPPGSGGTLSAADGHDEHEGNGGRFGTGDGQSGSLQESLYAGTSGLTARFTK